MGDKEVTLYINSPTIYLSSVRLIYVNGFFGETNICLSVIYNIHLSISAYALGIVSILITLILDTNYSFNKYCAEMLIAQPTLLFY